MHTHINDAPCSKKQCRPTVTNSGFVVRKIHSFRLHGFVVKLISTLGIQTQGLQLKLCHYSIGWQPWASFLLTLPLQFLSSKKLGHKKVVFGT